MIRKLTLFSLIISTLLASCSKENGETPEEETPNEKCIISSIEQTDSLETYKETYSFEYDDQGRITRTNASSDSAFTSFNIQYGTDKLTLKSKYWGTLKYTLDEQGRLSSFVDFDVRATDAFKYNQEGYLSEIVSTWTPDSRYGAQEPPSVYTYNLTYTGGNLTKITGKGNDRSVETEITFEYNNEEASLVFGVNDPLDQYFYFYPLPGYYGKTSKNQLVKATYTTTQVNSDLNIVTFRYEKDRSGKTQSIIRESKTIWRVQGRPDAIRFSYWHKLKLNYMCD